MSHERMAVTGATIEDLDAARLDAFLARRWPGRHDLGREDLASRLALVVKSATRHAPSVAGMLVFGQLPQLLHPEWGVVGVAIRGTRLSDPVAERVDIEGPAPELIDKGLAFAQAQVVGSSSSTSDLEYPEQAVREALINAVVHRDLRRPGRVAIRVFSDRLEIWSPGGPPDGVGDLDELSQEGGVSLPRNPILAATMRQLGYGEQVGRGLACVRRAASLTEGANAPPTVARVEVRATTRDVLVTLPSAWPRPTHADQLS